MCRRPQVVNAGFTGNPSPRLFDLENKFAPLFASGEKAMTGGLAEMFEILGRTGIGGDDPQHAARWDITHRLACLEHGERTLESAGIEEDRLAHRSAELIALGEALNHPAAAGTRCEPGPQVGLGASAIATFPGQAFALGEDLGVRQLAFMIALQDDAAAARH